MFKFQIFIIAMVAFVIGCTTAKNKVEIQRDVAQTPSCPTPKTSDFDEAIPNIDAKLRSSYQIPPTYTGATAFSAIERAVRRELAIHQGEKQKDQKKFLQEAVNICEKASQSGNEQ